MAKKDTIKLFLLGEARRLKEECNINNLARLGDVAAVFNIQTAIPPPKVKKYLEGNQIKFKDDEILDGHVFALVFWLIKSKVKVPDTWLFDECYITIKRIENEVGDLGGKIVKANERIQLCDIVLEDVW